MKACQESRHYSPVKHRYLATDNFGSGIEFIICAMYVNISVFIFEKHQHQRKFSPGRKDLMRHL